jgi:hypothetical protein
MSASRVEIEHALDLIASDEGGMRFQGLAVVLAKKRWPELIASERKKDLGLDAYASAIASPLGIGMGLSCSTTANLKKISDDAERAKPHFPDLKVLIFATSGKPSNLLAEPWKKAIKDRYGWELIVMSREEIIATLQTPGYEGVCKAHLGITVSAPEPSVDELIEKTLAGSDEIVANWSRRLDGKPIIDLRLVRLDEKDAETQEMQKRSGLGALLAHSQRVEIEAPAGRGKTTTLIELAREHRAAGRIGCLIDLPAWIRGNKEILEFLAGMPEFRTRGLTATDIAQVNRASPIIFLLNGWNELTASESTSAAVMVRNLERSYAASGIAVATRAHPVAVPLPGSTRFRIQPLTRQERREYLHGRLGDNAEELANRLRADSVLDELTRTPLILAEVVSLHEAGKAIPTSKLAVLDAVTHLMENDETHQAALADTPLSGFGRDYLQALATALVTSGGVQITETKARTIASAVAHSLQNLGQIGTLPDPGAVLTALCSHHVLDRSAYPDVTYAFIHQQFQELFAALHLKQELFVIAVDAAPQPRFVSNYVNEPAWTQPLEMLADFIGRSIAEKSLLNAVVMGRSLVEMTLPVDAVFAAKLARLCGTEVWSEVRVSVSARLRHLYGSGHQLHREIGLAGMVASGSEHFKDVLLPLLAESGSGSSLDVYRTGETFQVSSLGDGWQHTVEQWNEDARVSFVVEMMHRGQADTDVKSFALSDPSAKVQKAFLSNVWWDMSPDEVPRLSQTLNDAHFSDLITGMPTEHIPVQLRSRAAAMYAALGASTPDPAGRFKAWRRAYFLGHNNATEPLKQALSDMDAAQVRGVDSRRLHSTVDMLKAVNSAWVTDWVVEKVLSGVLSAEEWMPMVDSISTSLRDELLNRVMTENLTEMRIPGVIPLIRQFADHEAVQRLFRCLCDLVPVIAASKPGDDKKAEAELGRQIENLLREMPAPLAIEGILDEMGGKTEAVAMKAIGEIFHSVGRSGTGLREALPADVRERFRSYLKSGMETLLTQDDPYGRTKAYFATVLAQVSDASDLPELERLIDADLLRYRTERAARMAASQRPRRRRNP